MPTTEWLTPAEAGAILSLGPDRVAQIAKEGALVAMRTPGGHLRLRRDSVEDLANPPIEPSPSDSRELKPDDDEPERESGSPPQTKPKWEQVPPWKRRVREAEADVQVSEFDDQRERLLETRAERQAQRERAEAQQAAAVAEAERLRQLKSLALSYLTWNIPAEVQAEVARQLERTVTSDRFPAGLARAHAEALLKAEVERHLRPWRTREARRDRVREEAAQRKKLIDWAVFKAKMRTPGDWEYETKKAFEREVRKALEEEFFPGMDLDEANEIAFDMLDQWVEDDEDDS